MISISTLNSVGYGCGFGGAYARNSKYNNSHLEILKHLASNKNFNFIDTASEYGNGSSEKIIGRLNDKTKKKLFISTKVSSENLTYKKFINSVQSSLKRLRIKKIDLIQPHWPNTKYDIDEIVHAFKYLKNKKYVRYFGTSNYSFQDIKYFKRKLLGDFKFIQEEYSIVDRSIERDKLIFCKANDMKLIGYSPLGTGNLNFSTQQKKLLEKLGTKYDVSIFSIILNFLIKRADNIILIPNSMNRDNINSNINSQFLKLSKKEHNQIDNIFKFKTIKIKLKNINFVDRNYKKIASLDDAIQNKFGLSPSPIELSKKIKKGENLKPIKIRKNRENYDLIEGRLRFWAHVIAFGWNHQVSAILKI